MPILLSGLVRFPNQLEAGERRDAFENVERCEPFELRMGDVGEAADHRAMAIDRHHAIGLGYGERLPEHGVGATQHDDLGGESQRQRNRRRGHGPGPAAQAAQGQFEFEEKSGHGGLGFRVLRPGIQHSGWRCWPARGRKMQEFAVFPQIFAPRVKAGGASQFPQEKVVLALAADGGAGAVAGNNHTSSSRASSFSRMETRIWRPLPPGRSVRPMLSRNSVSPATSLFSSGRNQRLMLPWVWPGVWRIWKGVAG